MTIPFSEEDALAFISDLHLAHICCDILLEVISGENNDSEKQFVHEKALWDGANIALRRAFNSSRPMGSQPGKRQFIITRNEAPEVLKCNGWTPKSNRDFEYFYKIGDKVVAHGNKEIGKYEVVLEHGALILNIISPAQDEIIEFRDMCITLECFARDISGLDPEIEL